ncbi:hypothetical protein TRFO_24271 [Tritrichomonas foetus]|uniref:Uncharacterized protein n=1 Tax=Tritrichomonas foetus TaxID=1144522 RepID=A0A1J4KCN5_9EUKA|nr:hypothetical protein TRFO_24271 [Tritrichomonas foetus]|eukprot:OHT07460.1 hypothetical protein TRFO_24271 [Tritrichomonas foetus]
MIFVFSFLLEFVCADKGYIYDLEFTPRRDGTYRGKRLNPMEDTEDTETIKLIARLIHRYKKEQRKKKLVQRATSRVIHDFGVELRRLLRMQNDNVRSKRLRTEGTLARKRYRMDPVAEKIMEVIESTKKQQSTENKKAGETAGSAVKTVAKGAQSIIKSIVS